MFNSCGSNVNIQSYVIVFWVLQIPYFITTMNTSQVYCFVQVYIGIFKVSTKSGIKIVLCHLIIVRMNFILLKGALYIEGKFENLKVHMFISK